MRGRCFVGDCVWSHACVDVAGCVKDRATRVMVEVRVGDLVYEDRCPRQRDDSDHEGQP